jgi:hypothetical protein
LGLSQAVGGGFQLAQACGALGSALGQIADEGEVLALAAAGGQGQHQRHGPGQRHHRYPQCVGGAHDGGARVGDGGHAGFADQAQGVALLRGREQRTRLCVGAGHRVAVLVPIAR